MSKINGLDLFSGIGGISIGLNEYVRTIAYCENDRHAQSVLLSRMSEKKLDRAPIWDNITTLKGNLLGVPIDIISGGFPCQDISVAGKGAGLAGKRSGLFFEVCRLVKEIEPSFVFLENVPAIRTRGLREIVRELTDLGYDCRWTCVSAAEIGAPHIRKRWFLLAHPQSYNDRRKLRDILKENESQLGPGKQHKNSTRKSSNASSNAKVLADTNTERRVYKQKCQRGEQNTLQPWGDDRAGTNTIHNTRNKREENRESFTTKNYWETEPNMGRVANGIPLRVDRIKRLGNAVVPLQAKVAFEKLLGLSSCL